MSNSKFNLLVHLNAYDDEVSTNNPSRNHFKWNQDLQGIDVREPTSKAVCLQAEQSLNLFSGIITIAANGTTTWDIALKTGTSNTYVISHNAGTAPAFKTARSLGHDATTQVTVTKNAKLLTFSSTGGTPFALLVSGMVIGDEVRFGSLFNIVNQGKFKVISFSNTSITVENEVGQAEGPITLAANFATEFRAHSSDGVQVGDKIDIIANFSSVTFNTYEITDVADDFIEFFSTDSLPSETAVPNSPDAFLIYNDAKQFLYIESDQKLDIKINGSIVTNQLFTLLAGTVKKPGFFMSTGSIKSAEIVNTSLETANVFFVTAE